MAPPVESSQVDPPPRFHMPAANTQVTSTRPPTSVLCPSPSPVELRGIPEASSTHTHTHHTHTLNLSAIHPSTSVFVTSPSLQGLRRHRLIGSLSAVLLPSTWASGVGQLPQTFQTSTAAPPSFVPRVSSHTPTDISSSASVVASSPPATWDGDCHVNQESNHQTTTPTDSHPLMSA